MDQSELRAILNTEWFGRTQKQFDHLQRWQGRTVLESIQAGHTFIVKATGGQ